MHIQCFFVPFCYGLHHQTVGLGKESFGLSYLSVAIYSHCTSGVGGVLYAIYFTVLLFVIPNRIKYSPLHSC